MDSEKNNTQAALDAGREMMPHQVVEIDDTPIGFLHHDSLEFTRLDLKEHSHTKFRRASQRQAHTVADFCAMVARYGLDHDRLAVFASVKDRRLLAILNDDTASALETGDWSGGWQDDKITMQVEESRELTQWRAFFDWRTQVDLAEFLEEHMDEVDGGADIFEMAKTLDLTRESTCKSAIRLKTGSTRLEYNDETTSSVEIPDRITLMLPLFAGGPIFKMEAFLRYRLRGGGVHFLIKPKLLTRAIEQAFMELVTEAGKALPVPVFRVG